MKIARYIIPLIIILAAVVVLVAVNKGKKGTASAGKVQYLFVQTADAVTFAGDKMALEGVAPATLYFSDRPERIAGHGLTREFVEIWGEGDGSFAKDPPNATVSFLEDGTIDDVVVELMNPRLNGDTLTYTVKVIEGDMPESARAVSLFIDIIGRPLTPISYAGVARRTFRRGAFMY